MDVWFREPRESTLRSKRAIFVTCSNHQGGSQSTSTGQLRLPS